MSKTVPLSVRISHEDAEFLAQFEVENAKTPSDKVRAIISERRKRSLVKQPTFSDAYHLVEEVLAPISLKLKALENQENSHSELVHLIDEWLPSLLVLVFSKGKGVQDGADYERYESELFDKVFRLIESVLRMGVTEQSPNIDKAAVSKRLTSSLELFDVIKKRLNQ